MRKRIISIVLAVGMLMGTWDITALAKEAQPEKTMTAQAAYAQFNTSNMYAIANYGIKKQKNSDMLLKVPNNKNGRVNPMIISPADHSTGELYTFAKVGNWYTITPKCAGSWRLNVEGDKSNTNTDVGLWTNTNHSTQGWYLEPVSGVTDGYIIRSANNTSCVLDVRGTTTGKGVKIKKYEANNPCQIWIVRAYAASVSLNRTSATLDIGKTVTLSANKRPVDMPVTYSSASTKIATVNSKGVVTAKAAGTTTIYAKCCGKTAACTITVKGAAAKKAAATKSTLRVNSKLAKTTITQGSMDGVSGTVSSNKKITNVTAQIIGKSNKKVYYPTTVKPNRTSYDLKDIDKAMKFDKLGKGTYIFRVTAKDETGNTASKDIICTVKEKTKASGQSSKKGNYKKITYKLTPVTQCHKDEKDCGIASMATCELYNEYRKKGAYPNLISKHKTNNARLYAMRNKNHERAKKDKKGADWSYFHLIGYSYKKVSYGEIYSALKKGPVIVRKCRYSKGNMIMSHYSVVYEYSGNKNQLEAKGFKMIEVKNGTKTNLSSWLNGGISGKGRLVQVIGK